MKGVLVLVFAFFSVVSHAEDRPKTECRWDNTRDGANLESISNRKRITNVVDCANALGDYMLHWEPIRNNMFDGTVVLTKSTGEEVGRCITKTIRPINEQERFRLPSIVTVESKEEGERFSREVTNLIPWYTEEDSVKLLRTEKWQNLFRTYFEVLCVTPNS